MEILRKMGSSAIIYHRVRLIIADCGIERRTQTESLCFYCSQNLNLGVRSLGWRIDFRRFRVYLKDKFNVSKAFLFIGYVKENERLYSKLRSFGYELVFKPTVESQDGHVKGNVDAELVLYCAKIEFDNYNRAFIVSGDGDFHCLIKFLKEENKLGGVIVPNRKAYSRLLDDFWRNLIFVNPLRNKLRR